MSAGLLPSVAELVLAELVLAEGEPDGLGEGDWLADETGVGEALTELLGVVLGAGGGAMNRPIGTAAWRRCGTYGGRLNELRSAR